MNATLSFAAAAALLLGLSLALLWRPARVAGTVGGLPLATRLALAAALLAFVLGGYGWLGQPAAWSSSPAVAPALEQAAVGPAQIEAMVARLAAKLKSQPDDAQGWRMLARSYEQLQRPREAVQAYEQLLRLTPADADMLADYAVTLAMSLGRQSLVGEPEALIQRALAARPDHLQSLALAGSIALDLGRKHEAVAYWRRVLAQLPPESELAAQVARSVAQAEAAGESRSPR